MPEDSTGVAHSSLPGSALRQTCFVDMPFGKKVDPKTGVTVDFDQVFHQGIRPAVEAAGLQCIRGDQEETGGLIHTAMFARLLLAEFVVADMTTANPNVFYELGVRHALSQAILSSPATSRRSCAWRWPFRCHTT